MNHHRPIIDDSKKRINFALILMNALKVVTIVNSQMDLVKTLLVVGNVIAIPAMKSKRTEHARTSMNVIPIQTVSIRVVVLNSGTYKTATA